jgi:uncharacterized protein YoxC
VSVGEIAGLIAAIAFVALVGLIAVPLIKLGKVLDETREQIRDVGSESVPILTELQGTVRATNEELSKLAVVTEDVSTVSGHATSVTKNAAQMSSLLTITFGGPLIKTAALTAGVRKVLRRRPPVGARSSDLDGDVHTGPVQPRRAQGGDL